MNIHEVATPRRWQVPNLGNSGGEIEIAGWDFGGDGELALLQHTRLQTPFENRGGLYYTGTLTSPLRHHYVY